MYAADTLSRAPVMTPGEICQNQHEEDKTFVSTVTEALPASETRLGEYKKEQERDPECKAVKEHCITGWPRKHHIPGNLKAYYGSLTVHNDLLLYNGRIVVPRTLRKETLRKIHEGHQGIGRCHIRVRESVWWPGVVSDDGNDSIVSRLHQESQTTQGTSPYYPTSGIPVANGWD